MRIPPLRAILSSAAILALAIFVPLGVSAEDRSPVNTTMYANPAEGETASKGEFLIVHKGKGKKPDKGYFMKHEPGEISEYHLFVPEKLDAKKRYPLLIVYHGGKDGGSGKGLCKNMARLSTKKHPVIVLSPNAYTMDGYNEILKAGDVPVDPNRVMVFGFSSGGMGVRSAMVEFVRTKGAFKPAVLVVASTTASIGRQPYPAAPYIVMAGENETPDHMKHPLLKTRRTTCRRHAVGMQQVIKEVRYIEMQGHGHTSGKPEHRAVLLNLLRALPTAEVKLKVGKLPDELKSLGDAALRADWSRAAEEITTLDESDAWQKKVAYKVLRGKVFKAAMAWYLSEAKAVAGLSAKSETWERLRAFTLYDKLESTAILFEDTPIEDDLYKALEGLQKSKRWQAELDARKQYYEIARGAPGDEMRAKLKTLLEAAPDTEFGGNRTREKLLALDV